ncbi:MAG: hypothetical protein GXP08_07665 [Gammaproteobacteria bacterium]|nr:hypothetical protein [Gammaproteobacteria bacterium]
MRILFIAISSLVLFFPVYWLFSQAVGNNWGAGIATFFMYVWYPYMAMKFFSLNDAKEFDDISIALAEGTLEVTEYDVSSFIEIEENEGEEEGLHYLLSIGENQTLSLYGPYLYDAVDQGNFPSTKIRVFWNKNNGDTYGVIGIGTKLLPLKTIPPLTESQWQSSKLPMDRDIVESAITNVASDIERYAVPS